MKVETAQKVIDFINNESEGHIKHMRDYMFDLVTFVHLFRKVPEVDINVLELGTGAGHSLAAFIIALNEIGRGQIHTIDKKEFGNLDNKELYRSKFVTYTKGLSLHENTIKHVKDVKFDLIFHDLSHEYAVTEQELEIYGEFLKVGGLMLVHDTLYDYEKIKMPESLEEFLQNNENFVLIINKVYPDKIGLGVLLKVSA